MHLRQPITSENVREDTATLPLYKLESMSSWHLNKLIRSVEASAKSIRPGCCCAWAQADDLLHCDPFSISGRSSSRLCISRPFTTLVLPHPLAVRLVAMQSDGSKVDLCLEAWRVSNCILYAFEELIGTGLESKGLHTRFVKLA